MKTELENAIKAMTVKTLTAEKAGEAMQFAQAALNLSHALATVMQLPK